MPDALAVTPFAIVAPVAAEYTFHVPVSAEFKVKTADACVTAVFDTAVELAVGAVLWIGAATKLCTTTRSSTTLAGMVKVKAKVPFWFAPAATVLVTVAGGVMLPAHAALVSPTVCVPAAIAWPDNVIVTVTGSLAAYGVVPKSAVAVTQFTVTPFVKALTA